MLYSNPITFNMYLDGKRSILVMQRNGEQAVNLPGNFKKIEEDFGSLFYLWYLYGAYEKQRKP
jgi:hypothetical protein